MNISLRQCLESNQMKFEGHSTHPKRFSFGIKTYLSYSKRKGWDVVQLNFLQRLFRSFGAYKSTRLDLIAKKAVKIAPDEVTKGAIDHILSKWRRKNIEITGNCAIHEANVIGFPENHLDRVYRAASAQIFKEQYKAGDIILVEACDAGEKLHAKASGMTQFLPPDLEVQGWEPSDFTKNPSPGHLEFQKKKKELADLLKDFGDLLRKHFLPDQDENILKDTERFFQHFLKLSCSDEAIHEFEKKLPDLIQKIEVLNKYFQVKHSSVKDASKHLKMAYREFKESAAGGKLKLFGRFICLFAEIACRFEKKGNKPYYRSKIEGDTESIEAYFPLRDISLASEIDKYRKEGKRVFVYAGAAHLIPKWGSIPKVMASLAKEKHVLVTSKNGY